MNILIDEIVSQVRALDGQALLAPQVMQQIVRVVTRAVREELAHDGRVRDEQRINAGRDPRAYPA